MSSTSFTPPEWLIRVYGNAHPRPERNAPASFYWMARQSLATAQVARRLNDELVDLFRLAPETEEEAIRRRDIAAGLLAKGADLNVMLDGAPLLHQVLRQRDSHALSLFVRRRGGDCLVMVGRKDTDREGYGAMDVATAVDWRVGMDILARAGFELSDPARRLYCVENEETRLQKHLSDAMAMVAHRREALLAAIALGADPNSFSKPDLSVLHEAVLLLEKEVVASLLTAGADITRRHHRGETTLQMLWWVRSGQRLSREWHAMAEMLRASGAPGDGFKTLDEMTADELWQTPPGAHKPDTGIVMALQAQRFDLFHKAMAPYPERLIPFLTETQHSMGQSPIDFLMIVDALHVAFAPELWRGRLKDMRALWSQVEASAKKEHYARNYKACAFQKADFERCYRRTIGMMVAEKTPSLHAGSEKPGRRPRGPAP